MAEEVQHEDVAAVVTDDQTGTRIDGASHGRGRRQRRRNVLIGSSFCTPMADANQAMATRMAD